MKKGETYVLKTLVDKDYKNDDPFIEKIYTSFKVNDSVPSRTLFENKLRFFEEDLFSEHDSIRNSAIKSFDNLTIEKEDFPKLKEILENEPQAEDYFRVRQEKQEIQKAIKNASDEEWEEKQEHSQENTTNKKQNNDNENHAVRKAKKL